MKAFYGIFIGLACWVTAFDLSRAQGGCILDEILGLVDNSGRVPQVTFSVESANLRISALKNRFPGIVRVESFGSSGGQPLHRIHVPSPQPGALRVVVTAGLHGTEPLGVITALRLVERAAKDAAFRAKFDLTVYPMLNPQGLGTSTRTITETYAGRVVTHDPNRLFTPETTPFSALVRVVQNDLRRKKFDLAVDLHGANKKRSDFFMIKAKDDHGLSERILSSVARDRLLESREGVYPGFQGPSAHPNRYRMLSPGESVSDTPGTLKGFLSSMDVPYAYTLEYPRGISVPVADRLNFRLLESILNHVRKHGRIADHP